MFAKNKKIILGALAAAVAWAALYQYVLVQPNWNDREMAVRNAEASIDTWQKFYKEKKDHLALPDATAQLVRREQVLEAAAKDLKQAEFTQDWKDFTLAKAGSSDPNNYFLRLRSEVLAQAKADGLRLAAGLDDLGFRGKTLEEPVALNLARLFVLSRFLSAAKDARVADIQKVEFAKHRKVSMEGTEDLPIERLYLVPLQVHFRATERDLAQLLHELQRPADLKRAYFAVRAFHIEVKDLTSGVTECWVAAGALVTEGMAKQMKIDIQEEARPGGPTRPNVDAGRY